MARPFKDNRVASVDIPHASRTSPKGAEIYGPFLLDAETPIGELGAHNSPANPARGHTKILQEWDKHVTRL
jgi:hypothetical protein